MKDALAIGMLWVAFLAAPIQFSICIFCLFVIAAVWAGY